MNKLVNLSDIIEMIDRHIKLGKVAFLEYEEKDYFSGGIHSLMHLRKILLEEYQND